LTLEDDDPKALIIISLFLHHQPNRAEMLWKEDGMLEVILALVDKYDMYQAVRHCLSKSIKDVWGKLSAALVCDVEMQVSKFR
jgi:hypothetical protein